MASNLEFVNYKDFVEGLNSTKKSLLSDKIVVSNSTDGPRSTIFSTKYGIRINNKTYPVVQIDKYLVIGVNLVEPFGSYGVDYFYVRNDKEYAEKAFGGYAYKASSIFDSNGVKESFLLALGVDSHWSVPSQSELSAMRSIVGGNASGYKMLAKSSLWNDSATDEYGFCAIPTGSIRYNEPSLIDYRDQSVMFTRDFSTVANICRMNDSVSSSYVFNSINVGAYAPVRLMCVMPSKNSNPLDYGCEFIEKMPSQASKSGSQSLKSKNGVVGWVEDATPVAGGKRSVASAKIDVYEDGTQPRVDYYLVEDEDTHEFYFSKDLKNFEYAFTWIENTDRYSFGVRANGDIIACYRIELHTSSSQTDNNRKNPIVFLASEKWKIPHEVDFGTSLKPCGWLSGGGWTNLPDGSTIFCEYTRPVVSTANLWKIAKDASLLQPSSYVVKASYDVDPDQLIFKHFHGVQFDPFAKKAYYFTGDSDSGSFVYGSSDYGDNWEQVHEGSQKYCRLLNFVFTEDYVYWASDYPGSSDGGHPFFRAERGDNGFINYETITEWLIPHLGENNGNAASYGLTLIPELNILVISDRIDGGPVAMQMPVRYFDLDDNALKIAGYMYGFTDGNLSRLGFRTRFLQIYGRCVYGFGGNTSNRNWNKGFGNGETNIVYSLVLDFFRKQDGSVGFVTSKV